MDEKAVRDHIGRLLAWEEAHVGLDKAVGGLPAELRGTQAPGLPYSAWQILEHIRIAQEDILDFCVNANYEERTWPADYWPSSPEPPSAGAWDESIRKFKKDLAAVQALATDTRVELASTIPHGTGQTYLRELLLIADHTAYHVGELVVLRRLLGAWT